MKSNLLKISFVFIVIIIIASGFFIYKSDNAYKDNRSYIADVNEIEQLHEQGKHTEANQKAIALESKLKENNKDANIKTYIIINGLICILVIVGVFTYVYIKILKPFDVLSAFAANISKGDFDIPLDYERTNYFGEFTWAFDHMRNELNKAKLREEEAIENNKTVIATLSHDIKTPLASIVACAEGFKANIDNTPERKERYLNVLINKSEEVKKLTDDLLLHSISDMERLNFEIEKFEVCSFLEKEIKELTTSEDDVNIISPEFDAYINADKKRVLQIAENLINNAKKYAKTKVDIYFSKDDSNISIHFKDYGKGINDEDMPFIFDKFYRGKNSKDEVGSGLGLYIVKYLCIQMDGDVNLNNSSDGLEVIVSFPFV